VSQPDHEIEVEIKNAQGLHMRPALQIVELAGEFKSDITVHNDKESADAKSIMQMMKMLTTYGNKLRFRAAGHDAREALEEIRRLIEERLFDEPPGKPLERAGKD
jgi:phosphotransferase system HPr (HPr) family protein